MPGASDRPGEIRPDPNPHSNPTLKQSVSKTLNDGSVREYSNLENYVERYVNAGFVTDLDDLVKNYGHLIGEIFMQWVSTGQLGCLFAAKPARKPRENRWIPLVQLDALSDLITLPRMLTEQLDAAAEAHEAAVIIFPDIRSEQDLVRLVNGLCADPDGRWYRTGEGIDPDPNDLGLIGLRWVLASDASVNYVLGFAPLDTMPFTRRSPFTALFLRIRDEKRTPKHTEDGRVQVHLADLDSGFSPQAVHDRIWDATKVARKNHVEPEMTATARARVTFSVSSEAETKLCAPRNVPLATEQKC